MRNSETTIFNKLNIRFALERLQFKNVDYEN